MEITSLLLLTLCTAASVNQILTNINGIQLKQKQILIHGLAFSVVIC